MKRRYKPGDWFAVPLDAQTRAFALITHMAGTRVFAYFFDTRSTPATPCARFLISGLPLDDLRWPFIAAPLRVDPAQLELPVLGERGAFGRSWWVRTLDPSTLQTISRTRADRAAVQALPPAQILTATDVEARLREILLGVRRDAAHVICELRAPLDTNSLDVLAAGGMVQFSEPVDEASIAQLHGTLAQAQNVALRLHAMHGGAFDLRVLRAWPSLGEVFIDTANVTHPQALLELPALQRLRIGAAIPGMADVLPTLTNLRTLTTTAALAALPPQLKELHTIAAPLDAALLSSIALERLRIAHADDAARIVIPHTLELLELRSMRLRALPGLSNALRLNTLVLHAIRELKDLRPLHQAPALRNVVIEEMPQLHVDDFKPLVGTPLRFDLALGNRTMTREVYRLLASGNRSVRASVLQ